MSAKMVKGLGWLFIVLGVFLLVGTLLAINSTRTLLWEGVRTTGNVVDFIESVDDEGQTMYAPVFVFLDEGGVEHQIESNVSSSSYAYMMGQAVDVIYRPGKPEAAEIQSTFGLWGLAGILGFIGVIFIVAGVVTNVITNKLDFTQPESVEVTFGSGSENDSF